MSLVTFGFISGDCENIVRTQACYRLSFENERETVFYNKGR